MCCSDVSKCFPFKTKRAIKNGVTGITLEIKYRATFLRPVSSLVFFLRGIIIFFLIIIFFKCIYLFLAELGLRCCTQTFGNPGLLPSCVEPALTAVASPVAEHRFSVPRLQLCITGLVTPRHVKSFQTRNQTQCPLHWQADFYPLDH